jgi:Flp pilus assembly pilin Flp
MHTPRNVRRPWRAVRGANMVEYIILTGVIALAALGAFQLFGSAINKAVYEQAGRVHSI